MKFRLEEDFAYDYKCHALKTILWYIEQDEVLDKTTIYEKVKKYVLDELPPIKPVVVHIDGLGDFYQCGDCGATIGSTQLFCGNCGRPTGYHEENIFEKIIREKRRTF